MQKEYPFKLAAAGTSECTVFFYERLAFFCVLLGVANIRSGVGLSAERGAWRASQFDPGATTHKTRAEAEGLLRVRTWSELGRILKLFRRRPRAAALWLVGTT